MIDVARTLHPGAGIARAATLVPPGGTCPLWQAMVEVEPGDHAAHELPLSARFCGAVGPTRADALLRGAGEAVERFALYPAARPAAVRGRPDRLGAPALEYHRPDTALGPPESWGAELDWYPARRLGDGTAAMVPAALVDSPCTAPEAARFDPGPSGAASGHGYEMALSAALFETIERDAVLTAWTRGLRLPAFDDPDKAAATQQGDEKQRQTALGLWDRARAAGLVPTLAAIPTALPGVYCFLAGLYDEPGAGPVSVGCKASPHPWSAVVGALREAWQVREVLLNSSAASGTSEPRAGAPIVDEDDRIRHLASAAGKADARDWLAGFVPAEPLQAAAALVSAEDAVRAMVADGGDPLAVDLTPRLPERLRRMGWCVVKVVPAGYQQLRMDERPDWSWNLPRLERTPQRTGIAARFTGGYGSRPHPLP
ncbi:hypothetical protein GCM10027570_16480 [Streptomonospora sediminis]